jgi:acyl-CoA thioesterase I
MPTDKTDISFPNKLDYLRGLVEELLKPWPGNRTVNIVCHGHSVPSGYFQTPLVDPFHAYPHLLHYGLKQRFPGAVVNVIVTAIGGENSEKGQQRFETEVLNHRPDVVTIDYALNDRKLGLERAEKAWRGMIEVALARGTKVILLTPTHDNTGRKAATQESWQALMDHAKQVRRLAEEYGVALADSFAAFERYVVGGGELSDLLSHSNHPSYQGHQLVAAELLRWFPMP